MEEIDSMELHETAEKLQRALLVGLDTGEYDAEASMDELKELVKSAGAEPVITFMQKREHPDGKTCVGAGRIAEIAEYCSQQEIDFIVFDTELTPGQLRNIEEITNTRTIDRTMLILDIFALRAKTNEGKLQVELAQLKYMNNRLTGKGIEMSRLGGGVGTRGPGETKLETDRRHIRRRMEFLRNMLVSMEQHRDQLRTRRKKDGIITVAIVGYTNAGKSTLMNTLTQAGVLSEDKLFATLETTSRALKLPGGVTVMLIDTVGLVRRLPHHLVEAFKSTLEEASLADVILNLCDASCEEYKLHLDVTEQLLSELGCGDRPIITVFNKCDLVQDPDDLPNTSGCVRISAKSGAGIEELLQTIENNLPRKLKKFHLLVPFDKASLLAAMRKAGALRSEEYTEDGIEAVVVAEEPLWHLVEPYSV